MKHKTAELQIRVITPDMLKRQRQARVSQAKGRESRNSYKTQLENVQIMLAWEAGDLSEGQVSRLLGMDRVSLRQMRLDAIGAGMLIAKALAQ